ncbi:TetR/AcrR family transcriptional regulator [Evansella sp. AB-rgal1]|uniref:TetR/AcrR family transcriptional regulator n=1 Tax=Evansella sp. AB-rgal1 TaxID=3242696 RepID=UPI00359EA8B7
MDGFERRREQKKTEILEASLQLFTIYGVQKVSISEIAKKANVSQVTIYNYFESKHNLVHETILFYIDKEWEKAIKIIDGDLSYPEKIKQLLFNKKEAANNINEDFYNHFMKEYSTGNSSHIEEFYHERAIPTLMSFFNEGKETGFIDSKISNEAIFFYIHMMQEYMQREDVYSKILPLTEDIMTILFYGITGKSDKSDNKNGPAV